MGQLKHNSKNVIPILQTSTALIYLSLFDKSFINFLFPIVISGHKYHKYSGVFELIAAVLLAKNAEP